MQRIDDISDDGDDSGWECAECGHIFSEEAVCVKCDDGLSRCDVCAVLNGYCLECGGGGAIVSDDNPVLSCLCADCRAAYWDSYKTENTAWRLWDTGR